MNDGSSVVVDRTPPTLPSVTLASSNPDKARAKLGDVLSLTLTASH